MDKVQICNMALLRIGGQVISSLDETSREAQLCNVFYEECLGQILRKFPWPFAQKNSSLALLADDPPSNWGYAYALPTDYIQVQKVVVPGARILRPENEIAFNITVWAGVRALVTDQENAEITYTARVDESLFDPLFSSALAWLLATELTGPLMGKPELTQTAKQAYLLALSEARAEVLNESKENEVPCEFVSVRGLSL